MLIKCTEVFITFESFFLKIHQSNAMKPTVGGNSTINATYGFLIDASGRMLRHTVDFLTVICQL